MERLDIHSAERKVLNDVVNVLREIQNISNRAPVSATEGVELLGRVRTAAYEDLNQIPHEFLVLLAAQWLQTSGRVPCGVEWFWNPRQAGGPNEPDLLGKKDGKHIVSGEVTSSDKPEGAILKRMRATLKKLSLFQGQRFYFVRTAAMKKKAEVFVRSNGLPIDVVCLQSDL